MSHGGRVGGEYGHICLLLDTMRRGGRIRGILHVVSIRVRVVDEGRDRRLMGCSFVVRALHILCNMRIMRLCNMRIMRLWEDLHITKGWD